jgi:membrane-associated PAP2 superfamily phosphatase
MNAAVNIWRRYWRLLLALILAPPIAALFELTSLDRDLTALYYDGSLRGFPLRDHPFLQNLMHNGLTLVVIVIGAGILGAFLLTFILPQWAPHRFRLLWLFAGMAGGPLMVSLIKHYSVLHCPWDLAAYGGYAPYHSLFDRLPPGLAAGRCFPGGHSSGGFSLMAFYFFWCDSHPVRARIALAGGLAAGMLMGWGQIMRGAHFLSHNIWAAWVVWTMLAMLYHIVPPDRD